MTSFRDGAYGENLNFFYSVVTHKCRKIAFLGKQAVNLIKIKQTYRGCVCAFNSNSSMNYDLLRLELDRLSVFSYDRCSQNARAAPRHNPDFYPFSYFSPIPMNYCYKDKWTSTWARVYVFFVINIW